MRDSLWKDTEFDYVVGPAQRRGQDWQLIDPIRVTKLAAACRIMEEIRPPNGRAELWRGGQIVAWIDEHGIWRHADTAGPPAQSPVAPTAGSTPP